MSHVPGKRNQILGCIAPIVSRIVSRYFRAGVGTCGPREHFNMTRIRIFVTEFRIQNRVKANLQDKRILRLYVIRSLYEDVIAYNTSNSILHN